MDDQFFGSDNQDKENKENAENTENRNINYGSYGNNSFESNQEESNAVIDDKENNKTEQSPYTGDNSNASYGSAYYGGYQSGSGNSYYGGGNDGSYGSGSYNNYGYGGQNAQNNGGYGNYQQQPYGNYQQNGQYGNQYNGGSFGNDNNNKPGRKNSGLKVFIIVISVIVVLAAALMIGIFTRSLDDDSSSANGNTVTEYATENENSVNTDNVGSISSGSSSVAAGEASEVAKTAQKFNVGILVYANDSLYTEGSGVIIKEDDDHKYTYIVTCAHVINYNGVVITVLMEDGTEYTAEVVGLDTRTDLGVVRIEATGFTCAEIASSDELIVGQAVYAVGNPGGSEFFGSITDGIISAIDRPVSSSTGYEMECIQHTAAINPGNSGGALVNGEGKLIGINSMKIASTEYEGMGFAVPSSVVVEVFNSIIENGYVAGRPKLGISYISPSGYSQTYSMYVQMKGLPSGTIVIADISDDSDLADQDVKVGDMITKVNGKEMTDTGMLSEMIEDMSVGDTLTLTIVRVNTETWTQTEKDVKVTLVEDKGTQSTESVDDDSSSQNNPFGGSQGGSYEDWYEYFKEYYGY